MTTRHSSSLQEAFIDSSGRRLTLGSKIGKGGEGAVFDVEGEPSLAAKIYHQNLLDQDAVAKLQAMVSFSSGNLAKISAWPESLIFRESGNQPCGILMPKIKNARQLHELYGTATRRMHFPEVRWHHLLLAARNLAAAFDTMHTAGIVVGDVNQGNLLVDSQMRVKFIDCDSFQITENGHTFHCPVGTPHFTPSELQSMKLRDVKRTIDHDCFGMAVLIFHLIFVGRHPFAGRFRGQGDMTIEKAIAERRFAFSKKRSETLVDPPPASLMLEDLPPTMADLFEAAFRGEKVTEDGKSSTPRPSPSLWAQELESFMRQRKICSFDENHVHYDRLEMCPWCRIEDEGGPSFFVTEGGASIVSKDRMVELDRRINTLHVMAFPELGVKRLDPPGKMVLKELADKPRMGKLDYTALGMVLGIVACLAGIVYAPALIGGSLICLAGGTYLLRSSQGRENRKKEATYEATIASNTLKLLKIANVIRKNHKKSKNTYDNLVAELRTAIKWYRAEGAQLQEVLKQHRSSHLTEFLRKHLIRDHVNDIPGLNGSIVAMLESYNVETAHHIDQLILAGIPSISSVMVMELMQWRGQLERQFEFQPDHGVTQEHLKVAEAMATQRFKVAQARKVLMGSKQLDSLAHGGQAELTYALNQFDKLAGQASHVAKELRDFLSSRHKIERSFNHSKWGVLGIMLGVPTICYLFHLLFSK